MAYNQAIADYVCEQLALGRSLLRISKDGPEKANGLQLPSRWEIRNWEDQEPHRANSKRAREVGCHVMAEECVEIADNPQLGEIVTEKADGGTEIRREDMLGHRRLQIDTRMRLLGKWLPKIYGDKIEVDNTSNPAPASVPVSVIDASLPAPLD